MKTRDLEAIGIPAGACADIAWTLLRTARANARDAVTMREDLTRVAAAPAGFVGDATYGALAQQLIDHAAAATTFTPRTENAPYRIWGSGLEAGAVQQMTNACKLPVAVAGALMPDAHVGYGLPIGGVLATHEAVIPYAVGVDIACRMKLTVLDLPVAALNDDQTRLAKALERETRFGMGATFRTPHEHGVMDRDWNVTPVTARLKDRAWSQLGTSGSGNHFVEFGELTITNEGAGLSRGTYLALLSHSGSRGSGAQVAGHYSRLARDLHPELPKELSHLAWLDLTTEAGQEYWEAMELMGRYAAANHEVIHRSMARALGVEVMLDIENHHNFAWRERHRLPDGSEAEVDRAPQGRDAGRRRRARDHPGVDGHSGLRRAGEGRGQFPELGVSRCGPAHEPHQGQRTVQLGRRAAVPARARCDAAVGGPGRSANGATRTSTR